MQVPDAVKKFLEKTNFAVLATVNAKCRPQVTPVWFMVDGDEILMNTSRRTVKLRNVQANPHVAITVVDRDDPYLHVQIRGKMRVDAAHGGQDIDRLSLRYRGQPYKYRPGDSAQQRVSLRLRPTGFSTMGMR